MLFSSIAAACLLPLTIASPLVKRQSADNSAAVLQDIQTVVNDITKLNNTLNTFRVRKLTFAPPFEQFPVSQRRTRQANANTPLARRATRFRHCPRHPGTNPTTRRRPPSHHGRRGRFLQFHSRRVRQHRHRRHQPRAHDPVSAHQHRRP